MVVYIKNMVCQRCIQAVEAVFKKHLIVPLHIQLGEVLIQDTDKVKMTPALLNEISEVGFEIINDRSKATIERIKTLIIQHLQNTVTNENNQNLSGYLSQHLLQDYATLSNLFSAVEGITIEKYFILQRIERVKELIMYDEMNLKQIALDLNYSSTAHLSAQFKTVTGQTPSYYKKLKMNTRKNLDEV